MTGKVVLKMVAGQNEGDVHSYSERAVCIIGRAADCNIMLPDDRAHRTVSRYHCMLDINPPAIRIRDFGSLNGTFVNGEKIGQRGRGQTPEQGAALAQQEYDLNQDDEIRMGNTVIRVEIEQPEQAPVTVVAAAPETSIPTGVDDARDIINLLLGQVDNGNRRLAGVKGYSVVRELGAGTMGAVYLATRDTDGAQCALKIMLPRVAATEEATSMFLRETQNTRALHHANIVRLDEAGFADGLFYLTMEYCDGRNVEELMRRKGGRLSLVDSAEIILQALDGLIYAHAAPIPYVKLVTGGIVPGRGLIHRDIKPSNLFLSGSGNARATKIGDFGLAKAFDAAGLGGQSATGAVAGTPAFMPRQQVVNFKYARPEVDVWAMAATFYNMLTGAYPRDFSSGKDPWLVALQTQRVPIRQRNPAVPAALAEVLDTALMDEPGIAMKTAAELKKALVDAL